MSRAHSNLVMICPEIYLGRFGTTDASQKPLRHSVGTKKRRFYWSDSCDMDIPYINMPTAVGTLAEKRAFHLAPARINYYGENDSGCSLCRADPSV